VLTLFRQLSLGLLERQEKTGNTLELSGERLQLVTFRVIYKSRGLSESKGEEAIKGCRIKVDLG